MVLLHPCVIGQDPATPKKGRMHLVDIQRSCTPSVSTMHLFIHLCARFLRVKTCCCNDASPWQFGKFPQPTRANITSQHHRHYYYGDSFASASIVFIRFLSIVKPPQDALRNQTRCWSEYLFKPILGLAYICGDVAQFGPKRGS